MSYQVEISPEAEKELRALSGYVRAQALQILQRLSDDPYPRRARELRDKPNVYRIWLATKWCIVYRVDEEPKRILVFRVRRKEQIEYESL
jgi:mRNA-degrading endonuclease RelE of RelBE toxin-antitoxin system